MVFDEKEKGSAMEKIIFRNGILKMQQRIEFIEETFFSNGKPDAGTTIKILVNKLEKII